MKVNLSLKPIHDMNITAQNPTQSNSALRQVFTPGLDADLHFFIIQKSPSLALCKNTVTTGNVTASGM